MQQPMKKGKPNTYLQSFINHLSKNKKTFIKHNLKLKIADTKRREIKMNYQKKIIIEKGYICLLSLCLSHANKTNHTQSRTK